MISNSKVKSILHLTLILTSALMIFSCNSSTESTSETESSSVGQDGFKQIFDGKTFTDWDGDTSVWRIDSGSFIGEVTPTKQIQTNTFLIWRGEKPTDFELKAEYRISEGGNSGIQYRSEELTDIPHALKGYQADIDGENTYTGQNYEERGRGFLAMRGQRVNLEANQKPIILDSVGNSDELKTHIKTNDWNEIHLVVKGNNMKHYINGILMSEATDNDSTARKSEGVIGFQVHVTPSMKIEYKNIRYKKN